MNKACVICGKDFEARTNALCCGEECSRVLGRERWRRWAETHTEIVAEKGRKYRRSHPDKRRETCRKWARTHPENGRAASRRYAAAHIEKVRESQRERYATEEGGAASAAKAHNRRTRLSGIPMTVETVLELKAEYGGICPYCNTVIVKGHVDHVAPISRAGTNDRNNLVWVCQNCNVQKGDKSLLHFLLYRKNLAVAL